MRELFIAFGLFLFIEGILYALFPSKMKSMLSKLELLKDQPIENWWINLCNFRIYNYLLFEGQHMKKFKTYLFSLLILISFNTNSFSKSVPESFADLAEKLMPSVVNISTTQTVVTNTNPFPFQFPPGSPFEDMFKEFGAPQERKSSALGSGFIIDEKGIVVTNNHVIQDAEDIIVRVNGDKEFKATVIGADPLSDIAVLQLETEGKIYSSFIWRLR
jgi:S1-C subfamily serine protease